MLLARGLLKSKTNPKPDCNLKHIWSKLFYIKEDLHFEHGGISSYRSRISENVVLQVPENNLFVIFQSLQSLQTCAWLHGCPRPSDGGGSQLSSPSVPWRDASSPQSRNESIAMNPLALFAQVSFALQSNTKKCKNHSWSPLICNVYQNHCVNRLLSALLQSPVCDVWLWAPALMDSVFC